MNLIIYGFVASIGFSKGASPLNTYRKSHPESATGWHAIAAAGRRAEASAN